MKRLVYAALLWTLPALAVAGEQLFVWGVVKWNTGTPAAGVEIRLMEDGHVRAKTFSNQAGRYGFFDIPGEPGDYTLEAVLEGDTVGEGPLPVPKGARAPDLIIH